MTFHIDFETQVDEVGYELVPGGPAQPGDSETVLSVIFSTLQGKPVRPDRIVRRGGKLKIQRPFEKVTNLFKLFAKMAITPSGLLDFVNEFGPMLPVGNETGEDVLDGINAAKSISHLLRAYSEGRLDFAGLNGFGWSRVDVHFAFNSASGRPYLKFGPASFLHALHLEFGLFLTRDAQVRECFQCGGWFETGPGTGRRADARFCSDEHRILFHSLKRPRVGDTRA